MSIQLKDDGKIDFENTSVRALKYFPFPASGGFVRLHHHPSECQCEKICNIINQCEKIFTCTCHMYTYRRRTCNHIRWVYEKMVPDELLTFCTNRKLDYTCIKEIAYSLSGNEKDKFNYQIYFNNVENFTFNAFEKNCKYWKGYEDHIKRHELGRVFNQKRIELIEPNVWKVYKAENFDIRSVSKNPSCQVRRKRAQCHLRICSAFEICQVCRVCIHMYECNCDDYKNGFLCEHCHAVVIHIKKLLNKAYALKNQERYYRDYYRRNHFINIQMRLRHNSSLRMLSKRIDECQYEVLHESTTYTKYVVTQTYLRCQCYKTKECPICQICRHTLQCTCDDYIIGFLCVHVHAVAMNGLMPLNINPSIPDNISFISDYSTLDEEEDAYSFVNDSIITLNFNAIEIKKRKTESVSSSSEQPGTSVISSSIRENVSLGVAKKENLKSSPGDQEIVPQNENAEVLTSDEQNIPSPSDQPSTSGLHHEFKKTFLPDPNSKSTTSKELKTKPVIKKLPLKSQLDEKNVEQKTKPPLDVMFNQCSKEFFKEQLTLSEEDYELLKSHMVESGQEQQTTETDAENNPTLASTADEPVSSIRKNESREGVKKEDLESSPRNEEVVPQNENEEVLTPDNPPNRFFCC